MHFHLSASSPTFAENQTGQSARNTHCSSLANTDVVPSPATIPVRSTLDSAFTPGSSETPLIQSTHPLHKKLHLMVCPVSGEHSAATTFQKKLPMCSWPLGGQARRNSTKPILTNGWRFAVRGRLLTIHHR